MSNAVNFEDLLDTVTAWVVEEDSIAERIKEENLSNEQVADEMRFFLNDKYPGRILSQQEIDELVGYLTTQL